MLAQMLCIACSETAGCTLYTRHSWRRYAQSALPLLLPAVEAGIVHDNWRIRQSSIELLGDLLFKVCAFMPFGKSLSQAYISSSPCARIR